MDIGSKDLTQNNTAFVTGASSGIGEGAHHTSWKKELTMKFNRIVATLGFAAAMSAQAQPLDAHAQAEALLSSGGRGETNAPQLPSVAPSEAIDSQMRAANLLRRPLPSESRPSEATTPSQPVTGTAPDAQDLARHLLDRGTLM